jgi:hypothetical protein
MSEPLAVVAVGAVTPAGLTALQTWTALRAAVTPFKCIQWHPPPVEPFISAPIPAKSNVRGTGADWLVNLGARAIGQCLESCEIEPARIALLLALPDGYRRHPALQRIGAAGVLAGIEAKLGCAFSSAASRTFEGSAGALQGIAAARVMLAAHRVDACLIAGVDSLLNRTDVDRLHDAGLIHEPGNPQGIIPGEGAACLLVRRAGVPPRPPPARAHVRRASPNHRPWPSARIEDGARRLLCHWRRHVPGAQISARRCRSSRAAT